MKYSCQNFKGKAGWRGRVDENVEASINRQWKAVWITQIDILWERVNLWITEIKGINCELAKEYACINRNWSDNYVVRTRSSYGHGAHTWKINSLKWS